MRLRRPQIGIQWAANSRPVPKGCDLYHSVESEELPAEHLDKIADILGRLDVASEPSNMDIPGFRLRALDGEREGHWAVQVAEDLLIGFRFEGSDVTDVDLLVPIQGALN